MTPVRSSTCANPCANPCPMPGRSAASAGPGSTRRAGAATGLSGRAEGPVWGLPRKRPSHPRVGGAGDLARSSLLALVGFAATGCLVTDVPDYAEPQPTPPFMLEATANPTTTSLLRFEDRGEGFAPVSLTVNVVSEDDGRAVEHRFFLSGRSQGTQLEPDSYVAGPDLEPGSLTGEARVLTGSFRPRSQTPPGCYQLFWLASHGNSNSTDCPIDAGDYSQINWTVLVCSGDCTDAQLLGCAQNDPQVPCLQQQGVQ